MQSKLMNCCQELQSIQIIMPVSFVNLRRVVGNNPNSEGMLFGLNSCL